MKLRQLLNSVNITEIQGDLDIEVSELSLDSRDSFGDSSLFFAVRGSDQDGHNYINSAIEKGAMVIICEDFPADMLETVCYVKVQSVHEVVGQIASEFYNHPTKELTVIGVTGTNGKTSIAYSLYQALSYYKENVALFSTISNIINNVEIQTEHTTQNAILLQKQMREAVDSGARYACMEVSSHALDQARVNGIDFDIALFTNLSQDHLDYHHTMEAYADAKKRFFDMLLSDRVAIVNSDDEYSGYMVQDTKAKILRYGTKNADYTISSVELRASSSEWKINDTLLESSHIGLFNVYNQSCIYACLDVLGYSDIENAISSISGIPGRMNIIRSKEKELTAIVDYAHTPDALKNVLETLKQLPHRKILCVFGCGGDRDRTKRPLMAKVAEDLSDIIVITNDNPRTESEKQIFDDIEMGFTKSSTGHALIPDREEAIRRSIKIAQAGDIILVAGKGHEDYQIIGTQKFHFDD